jgi:uncharacterized membrane protein
LLPVVLQAILEYGHIISAMGWLGGAILTTFVLGPSLRELPPPAALQFNAKVLPRIIRFVQATVGSTLLFGLLFLYSSYDMSSFLGTIEGVELSVGIVLALVVAVIAWTITIPSFNRVSKISNEVLQGGQQAPPPEMMAAAKRARTGATVATLLLFVVLATMVAAGY